MFQNLRHVLQAAGGDLSDLLKITTYITRIEDFPAVAEIRSSIFPGELPASTLIVVQRLAQPELLIEVEGMAARRRALAAAYVGTSGSEVASLSHLPVPETFFARLSQMARRYLQEGSGIFAGKSQVADVRSAYAKGWMGYTSAEKAGGHHDSRVHWEWETDQRRRHGGGKRACTSRTAGDLGSATGGDQGLWFPTRPTPTDSLRAAHLPSRDAGAPTQWHWVSVIPSRVAMRAVVRISMSAWPKPYPRSPCGTAQCVVGQQVMGFHAQDLGYPDVEVMVQTMVDAEDAQLDAMSDSLCITV